MKKNKEKPAGLKISQLARLADVPIPTIKYYLKEGLLPRPAKTGRTMSYYGFDCVEKVRLIKRLRTERFFPLSVIRRLIESGATADGELALGEAMMHIPAAPADAAGVSRKQIAGRTGYSLRKIDRMESLGLITPRLTPRGKEYESDDCQVIALVRQREKAGLPFDYSLEMMSIYRRHIQRIVQEDARLFIRRMLPHSSPADAARHIREGDKALGAFMPLIKAKLVRAHAEKMVDTLNLAPPHIKEIFHFRSISRTAAPVSDIDDPFRRMFISAIRKNGKFLAAEMNSLGRSLLHMVKGDFRQSEQCLKHDSCPSHLLAFASVLEALAQYGNVSSGPGVFSPVHGISSALCRFESSREKSSASDTWLLTTYFRGAGLSIIPDIFDTHPLAHEDLTAVVDFTSIKKAEADDTWNRVLVELRLKCLYFLAEMYLHDDNIEAARDSLNLLRNHAEKDFYRRWATSNLKRLPKVQGLDDEC